MFEVFKCRGVDIPNQINGCHNNNYTSEDQTQQFTLEVY